jgi:hypothetical protein
MESRILNNALCSFVSNENNNNSNQIPALTNKLEEVYLHHKSQGETGKIHVFLDPQNQTGCLEILQSHQANPLFERFTYSFFSVINEIPFPKPFYAILFNYHEKTIAETSYAIKMMFKTIRFLPDSILALSCTTKSNEHYVENDPNSNIESIKFAVTCFAFKYEYVVKVVHCSAFKLETLLAFEVQPIIKSKAHTTISHLSPNTNNNNNINSDTDDDIEEIDGFYSKTKPKTILPTLKRPFSIINDVENKEQTNSNVKHNNNNCNNNDLSSETDSDSVVEITFSSFKNLPNDNVNFSNLHLCSVCYKNGEPNKMEKCSSPIKCSWYKHKKCQEAPNLVKRCKTKKRFVCDGHVCYLCAQNKNDAEMCGESVYRCLFCVAGVCDWCFNNSACYNENVLFREITSQNVLDLFKFADPGRSQSQFVEGVKYVVCHHCQHVPQQLFFYEKKRWELHSGQNYDEFRYQYFN